MKRILLTAALLLTVGCSRPAEVEAPSSLATFYTGTPQVFNAKQEGWKIGVLEPRDEGRDFTVGDWPTHEAVDRWIIVPVVVQNTTDRRQDAYDSWDLILSAGLVGTDDQLYEMATARRDENHAYDEPFEPGEARQVLLLYDVPENVQPKQLLTDINDTFNSLQIDL